MNEAIEMSCAASAPTVKMPKGENVLKNAREIRERSMYQSDRLSNVLGFLRGEKLETENCKSEAPAPNCFFDDVFRNQDETLASFTRIDAMLNELEDLFKG